MEAYLLLLLGVIVYPTFKHVKYKQMKKNVEREFEKEINKFM